ncbi:MAG: UvrD-helicase domain-containing protein, partial [Methanobacteriota archaeon]
MRLLPVRIQSHSGSSFQHNAHGICTQAPQLILASAGTGKTTTITAKIAHIVECGIFDNSRVEAMRFEAVRGHIGRRDINI